MKMIELEINNIRGIPDMKLVLGSNNFVVWGPNGSGKSAVVDAIDFLLTGQISRLTGRGTGNISLNKHGAHISHEPEDAIVRAIIQLPGIRDPFEIKRCLADPNTLECEETDNLNEVLTIAKRGQYVLTRRDILKYITSEASTRAQEIQELLNITDIEKIRKTFVSVHHNLDHDCQATERNLEVAKGGVNATIQEKKFNKETVLQFVNKNRVILHGKTISILCSENLKKGLEHPTLLPSDQIINVQLLQKDIQNLNNLLSKQNQAQIAKSDKQLRDLLEKIKSDPQFLRDFSRQQLIELGITLIDETGNCPLCDTTWPLDKLREYLENKLSTVQIVAEHYEQIKKLSTDITGSLTKTMASLQKVIKAAQMENLKDDLIVLQSWLNNLQELSNALSDVIKKYPDERFNSNRVQQMLAPQGVVEILSNVYTAIKSKYPRVTPEQTAWDTLTRLEANLNVFESAETAVNNARLSQQRAKLLLNAFINARDNVLEQLYNDVRDNFVIFYRQLHELDESKFSAKIEPKEAGLNFEVDFYGYGTHPPHALHSEGHQDSMGICLFLALAEHLTKGVIDLIILDDVVMSVDAEHRRQICRLLATSFPHRQFIITTHDKTWANQLKSEGIVDSKGFIEFYNWNIETGPQINYQVDMWDKIEEDLIKSDIPSAAGKLRRGSEEFFGMVCDALQAPVKYKLNGRWELGDFLPAAMKQYRILLRQAKQSAQSWGDKDRFGGLQEHDSIVGSIFSRANVEQWAVNVNVHYSNWANFSEKDFRPVVEAFQDLCGLFRCSDCGGILRLAISETTPLTVRCSCGKVDWNLTVRKNKIKPPDFT